MECREKIKLFSSNEIKSPTCIWSPAAVGSGRGSSVTSLNLQSEGSLLLPVKHLLGEDLPGLGVDLEGVLPLVPDAVHDVVVDLVVWECSIFVNGINPVRKTDCVKILENLVDNSD